MPSTFPLSRVRTATWSLLGLCLALAACSKQEAPATPYDRIQGKWQLNKVGSDDNENGQIDLLELHPLSSSQNNQIVFNKDGTGLETDTWAGKQPFSLAFKWQIVKGDSVTLAYAANDTVTYLIAAVSSAALTLVSNGSISLEEYYYIKK